MSLQIKVDTNEVPSILGMLGIGGLPKEAAGTGNPPPVDPALGGADNPTGQPATSDAASAADAQAAPKESKLSLLQRVLSGNAPEVHADPNMGAVQQPGAMPPPDLAQSMVSEQPG